MTNAELLAFVKKNPISIGCGVLSLLLAGGIYYRSGDMPDAETALTQKVGEAERYEANLKNASQLKEQLEAMVDASKEVDRRLIRVGQSLTNYQYFYKLESETGAKLTVDQTTKTAPKALGKAGFVPIGFNVTVQGNLAQVLDFLRRLESGAHYCRVLSANCSTTGVGATPGAVLNLNVNLEMLGLP